MKAILVIDMPDICYKCPCYDHEGGICQATSNWKADRKDGCPLKPIIDDIPEDECDAYVRGFTDGILNMVDDEEIAEK